MQLKKPLTLDSEAQYLAHCTNIAVMLSHTAGTFEFRLQRYFEITGAEVVEEGYKKKSGEQKSSGQKLCPQCGAGVEFAQDPLRICNRCGWIGDYTKLEDT